MELHAIGMQRSVWSKTRSLRPLGALANKGRGSVFNYSDSNYCEMMGLGELPLRANLPSANYMSPFFFFFPFFPQQSLCVASGTGPPEGPEVVLRGAGARWYPRLFEAARLKLARVFEATAFEAVGLEAGARV